MNSSRQNAKEPASAPDFPLRLRSADDFARVESLLRSVGFDEANVCRVFRVSSLADIDSTDSEEINRRSESPILALFIRIFMLLEPVSSHEVQRLIDVLSLKSMLELDLLRTGSFGPSAKDCVEAYYSPVLLYPVMGLLIASDRRSNPDGSPYLTLPDVVFPAIHSGTLDFLRMIPRSPAGIALDLGTGSGVGALVLSRHVDSVVATDITARAIHFTRFNQLLNRCSNVELIQGDLYSAVEGRSFDRIIAHPPYVPSKSQPQVYYRDAAEGGEEVLRRIVEGLPDHLNPGGAFCCVCAGWDRAERPFEERLRGWLGDPQREFDIIVAVGSEVASNHYSADLAEQEGGAPSSAALNDGGAALASVEKFVYGAVFIRRRGEDERHSGIRPLSAREKLSSLTDGACFEWAVRWHRWCAERNAAGDLQDALCNIKPRFGSSLQVRVRYAVQRGTLLPSDVVLESGRPFLALTKVDEWVVPVMGIFDGSRTVSAVYERARGSSMLPQLLTLRDFASLTGRLIKCGYLESDDI